MNRFFLEKIKFSQKDIILSDPGQLHHLRDVLRIKPHERIIVFDNSGDEYIASVNAISSSAANLGLIEKKHYEDGSTIKITVACAIPKSAKLDDIIDKLTQLGVECIIPVETERVIVKLNRQKKIERWLRWKKIALSAAKQSQGSRLPIVKQICGLKEATSQTDNFDLKLIPTLEGARKTLREIFANAPRRINRVMVLIGPEGDFTPGEVSLAKDAGFLPTSLGRQILRVDTAAIAVVSYIKLNEEF